MSRFRSVTLLSAVGAAAMVAWSCDRGPAPVDPQIGTPLFWEVQPTCFRLTGGGRIDKSEDETGPSGGPKNTPDSRDFATFGFQARPVECFSTDGSGQFQWVDHTPSPEGFHGGFSFHGVVDFFGEVADHFGETGNPKDGCGRFSGTGRFHGRDGLVEDDVEFVVEHACDRGEPGRNSDHIRLCLGTRDGDVCEAAVAGGVPYRRDGVLTGGNIQKHKLTGSGA